MRNLHEFFEERNDEFLKWDRVEGKKSTRPDLHAFVLLNEIIPGDRGIVGSAEHDQIWLDVDCDELNAKATDEQLIELIRCGVFFEADVDSLSMFV